MYNQNQYNQSEYNIQLANIFCGESISASEYKPLEVDQFLTEFIFMTPDVRVEISNKGLSDLIRINDWLTLKKLFIEEWHD